jgi:hypothetical protein
MIFKIICGYDVIFGFFISLSECASGTSACKAPATNRAMIRFNNFITEIFHEAPTLPTAHLKYRTLASRSSALQSK